MSNNNTRIDEDGGNSDNTKWYKKITVEPTMFLYMMAFMLTTVVEQAFYLNRACVTNHGYSPEICNNITQNETIKKEVQVSDWLIVGWSQNRIAIVNAHEFQIRFSTYYNVLLFSFTQNSTQITVSHFYQWYHISGHVVPIVLAFFLGSWSDRRGRKLPLLLGLFGKLIYSSMILVNVYNSEFLHLGEW